MQKIKLRVNTSPNSVQLSPSEIRIVNAVSPTVDVERTEDGAEITVHDVRGTQSVEIYDGEKGDPGRDGADGQPGRDGQDGAPGQDGFSPTVDVTEIEGGHRVTITDAEGEHVFDVVDGSAGVHVVEYSFEGEEPTLVDATYSDISGWLHNNELVVLYTAMTGTAYYQSYTDRGELGFRSINGEIFRIMSDDSCEIIDVRYATEEEVFGALSEIETALEQLSTDVSAKYTKPATGIPASDLAANVIPDVPVQDVQIDGTSVVDNGVANIPMATLDDFGVVKTSSSIGILYTGAIGVIPATDSAVKLGNNGNNALVSSKQHMSTFYGLAKAAGDTTQSQSANPVGTYTDNAKTAIKAMLGITDANVHVVEYDFDGGEPFLVDVTYNDINGWLRNNELVVLYSASAAKAYYLSHIALGQFIFLGVDGDIFLVKSDDTCEIIESKYAREDNVGSEFENVYSELEQKYSKPSTGIPASDLASSVQTSLGNADTAYQKPSTGIPSTDLASTVQTSLANADSAYQKPSTGIPASDLASGVIPSVPVQDVQVNGTSVLGAGGVANVPVASVDTPGVVEIYPDYGIGIYNNKLLINGASSANTKAGNNSTKAVSTYRQHESVFYGLTKAAGVDMASSSNPVGTYTDEAKSAISQMLNAPVSVSGTTPAITGLAGVRYICGECATLSIVAPESGCVDVTFTSGATATVLTVTSAKTGVTAIKWTNGFDTTSLEANTVYEVNILDGEYGVVGSWT